MPPPIAISGRDRPEHTKYPKRRGDDCDEQRACRQHGIIGGLRAGLVRQHGNEVRGPNSAGGANAGQEQPAEPHHLLRVRNARIDAEGCERRGRADRGGQQNQKVIVLNRQTIEYAIHFHNPRDSRCKG